MTASSDDLELFEEGHDALVGLALVFDDFAGFAHRRFFYCDDFLACAGPADGAGIDAEVSNGELDRPAWTWRP